MSYQYPYRKTLYSPTDTIADVLPRIVQLEKTLKAAVCCGSLFGGEYAVSAVQYATNGWHDVSSVTLEKTGSDSRYSLTYSDPGDYTKTGSGQAIREWNDGSGWIQTRSIQANRTTQRPDGSWGLSAAENTNYEIGESGQAYEELGFNPGEKSIGSILKTAFSNLEIIKDSLFHGGFYYKTNSVTDENNSVEYRYSITKTDVSPNRDYVLSIRFDHAGDEYYSIIQYQYQDLTGDQSFYIQQTLNPTYNTDGVCISVSANGDLQAGLPELNETEPNTNQDLVHLCESLTKNCFVLSNLSVFGYALPNQSGTVFEVDAGTGTQERPQYMFWAIQLNEFNEIGWIRATITWNTDGWPSSVHWELLNSTRNIVHENLGTITISYNADLEVTSEVWS